MPSLLFIPNTFFRLLQFLLFWFFAWLVGKKNNPLITLIIILGIVLFNLLIPYGRVLYSIGVFKITAGALVAGIHRAVTLEGLIMLSRVTIREDLRLPGSFGALIGESFRIFTLITERKHVITRKNFVADIDHLLIGLSEEPAAETAVSVEENTAGKRGSPLPGIIVLVAVVVLAWLPWIFIIK
jgi:heptaprenyl diphosphate synthase